MPPATLDIEPLISSIYPQPTEVQEVISTAVQLSDGSSLHLGQQDIQVGDTVKVVRIRGDDAYYAPYMGTIHRVSGINPAGHHSITEKTYCLEGVSDAPEWFRDELELIERGSMIPEKNKTTPKLQSKDLLYGINGSDPGHAYRVIKRIKAKINGSIFRFCVCTQNVQLPITSLRYFFIVYEDVKHHIANVGDTYITNRDFTSLENATTFLKDFIDTSGGRIIPLKKLNKSRISK